MLAALPLCLPSQGGSVVEATIFCGGDCFFGGIFWAVVCPHIPLSSEAIPFVCSVKGVVVRRLWRYATVCDVCASLGAPTHWQGRKRSLQPWLLVHALKTNEFSVPILSTWSFRALGCLTSFFPYVSTHNSSLLLCHSFCWARPLSPIAARHTSVASSKCITLLKRVSIGFSISCKLMTLTTGTNSL